MDLNKLEAYKDNEAFIRDIEKATNLDEFKEIASRYGIELSDAEINSMITAENAELTENDLDRVAGGVIRRCRTRVIVKRVPFPPFIVIQIVFY